MSEEQEVDFTVEQFPEQRVKLPLTGDFRGELIIELLKVKEENKEQFRESIKFVIDPAQEIEEEDKVFLNKWNQEEKKKEQRKYLLKTYNRIKAVLKEYVDMSEEYYTLTAIWIIGTYMHEQFNTYPYLFINAMRGSGKTKTLKLIMSMAYKGDVLSSPTEAVLFRYPKGHSLGIDEYEGMTRKGQEGTRELLNSAYKKGSKVRRIKKVNTKEGSEMQIEEFEPFRPIALANIWGMEEVLGDRCITIVLEKSERKDVMRLIEDFFVKEEILMVKSSLEKDLVQLCSVVYTRRYIEKWNNWVKMKYNTPTTYTTYTTLTPLTTLEREDLVLFECIDGVGINGRNLELFFPLMLIAKEFGEEVFQDVLKVAGTLSKEKREEEMVESKDVSLFHCVSKMNKDIGYNSIRNITTIFRNFLGNVEDFEEKWINEKWVGKALKRLGLVVDKRRLSQGIEVTLDIEKAKRKMELLGK